MQKIEPIVPTNKNFNKDYCHLGLRQFDSNETKALNHCHRSGEILGYSCIKCNLNCGTTYRLPLIIRNGKNYVNIIFRQLSKKYAESISKIPVYTERFLSFTLDNVKFLDIY